MEGGRERDGIGCVLRWLWIEVFVEIRTKEMRIAREMDRWYCLCSCSNHQ